MVVLEDADLGRAAEGAVRACFSSSGQLCISIERLYVADAIYDEFRDAVPVGRRGDEASVPGTTSSTRWARSPRPTSSTSCRRTSTTPLAHGSDRARRVAAIGPTWGRSSSSRRCSKT